MPIDARSARVKETTYLACACIDKQEDLPAARLLGALDAVIAATGLGILDPATRQLRERYEAILRSRGEIRKIERARSAGRETPLSRLRGDLERLIRGRKSRTAQEPGVV